MPAILEVHEWVKKFGDFTVKGVSFDIQVGEIFSLLGPNGAGNTTTISMLSTLYVPTSGDASIGGHSVTKEPMAVRALIQMVLLMVFGTLVMGVNWASQPLALAIVMVASCLAAAALGTMLGTFIKTAEQANGLSIMIGMVMAMLGGCWYPLELFPQVVQQAVRVLPTTWAMNGMLDLLLRGQGVMGILPEAGVLLGFALVFFVVGIWRFRYE